MTPKQHQFAREVVLGKSMLFFGFLLIGACSPVIPEVIPEVMCTHQTNLWNSPTRFTANEYLFRDGQLIVTDIFEKTYTYNTVHPMPHDDSGMRFFSGHKTLLFYDNYEYLWTSHVDSNNPAISSVDIYRCSGRLDG